MKKQTGAISFLTILCFLFVIWLPCQAADNEIYACKNKKTGTPRFVNAPNKCKKTEHLVTLNGQTQAVDPIVGHWSFMQYNDGTSSSINPQSNPGICVGELDITPDLTYTLWNSCRRGDNPDLQIETATGSGLQKSPGFYIFGSYVVMLSGSGNIGFYYNLLSNHPGHYEHAIMLKDVVFDHAELHR